jgi:hypothetical protein
VAAVHSGEYPHLDQLFGANFFPCWEENGLDPVFLMDAWLWSASQCGELAAVHEQMQALVARTPDEAAAEQNLHTFLSQAGLPETDSYLGFLHLAASRVARAVADPSQLVPLNDDLSVRRHRFSKFTDKETANAACTDVLRANEAHLRAWSADFEGLWRQHYYADVGHVVGTVKDTRREFEGPVTAAVVVMKLDHETRQPFIYDAYPELPLDVATRRRYPDLPHLFGGYFGDVHDSPWPAQQNFQASTKDPGRSRIRAQLDELLALDDAALAAAVEALGSHVLPRNMPVWVELIRWRLDRDDPHPACHSRRSGGLAGRG